MLTERAMAGVVRRAMAQAAEERDATRRYGDYNVTDIVSEAELSGRLPELSPDELAWWRVHERINRRGVHIDRVGVENCIAVVEQAFARYNGELVALTGIDAASKVAQLQAWLRARGLHLDSLDEDAVDDALARDDLAPDVRRVLQIRAAVGSASIKKLYAIRNRLSHDDRLRDLYVWHGARTGRCVAEGQPVAVRGSDGVVTQRAIEDVRPDDLVWDGDAWVAHEGVVCSGEREVIEHDGIVATPGHEVYVDGFDEPIELADAQRQGLQLRRAGAAASKGLKQFWVDLKNDPVRYADYLERRRATLLKTIGPK